MLHAVARMAIAAPRRIIAAAVLFTIAAAIFGIPVVTSLSAGGFQDPTSQSWHASRTLADTFDQGDMQMVIAVTTEAGVDSDLARSAGSELEALLRRFPFVADVKSAWAAPQPARQALVSKDAKTGLIIAGITGGETGAQKHASELNEQFPRIDGVTIKTGGEALTYVQTIEQTTKDLLVMEVLSLPLSFVILVWVFGGLMAAALPLVIGVSAILGSMAVLRLLTFATEVSVFSLNLALALGLALAVDYTLLIVSRYRDELASGADPDDALIRTMTTAGRTVLFSATTVALSMSALVLFPMYFLKSFAYASVAVVALTAIASIVVTPAAIVVMGDRIDALDVRRGARRLLRRPDPGVRPIEDAFFYRWARFAMRRAVPVGLAIITLLLVLGAPFLGLKLGYPDDRVLPGSAQARQVGDGLRTEFAVNSLTDVIVVIPDVVGLTPLEVERYAADLSRTPDVTAVSTPAGSFVDGTKVGPPTSATGWKDGRAFLTVNSTAPLYSDASATQLDRLHAVAPPGGREVQLAGWAQLTRDSSDAVTSRLPVVLSIMAMVTAVLLFLLTGSVVLPLKALVLNVLSLTAAFGALVWIFQSGHLGAFGTTATGTLVASVPILLFCLAFGLSMDYEVFLLSRIREFWLASGRTRADNDRSVALGLARTGRVVTAAALLMAVTFAALMAAEVSVMRMLGVGVTLAVLMDATLVRMLLMPAFMRVLGCANWWAPRPLARLHRRFGISESPGSAVPRGASVPAPVGAVESVS